jgi:AcrR family transcriptional regulator
MSIDGSAAKEPKRERGKQRVAALLDAGAALFVEKGYDATTMTEIAARAGAAIGSLYQFFPSKEALAEALFSRYTERAEALLEDLVNRAPKLPPAQLANLLVDLMLELRSDRDAAIAFASSISRIVDRRKPLRHAMRRQIAPILRSANKALTDAQATAASIMITEIMKSVPVLAATEEESGLPLLAEARKVLTAYIGGITNA